MLRQPALHMTGLMDTHRSRRRRRPNKKSKRSPLFSAPAVGPSLPPGPMVALPSFTESPRSPAGAFVWAGGNGRFLTRIHVAAMRGPWPGPIFPLDGASGFPSPARSVLVRVVKHHGGRPPSRPRPWPPLPPHAKPPPPHGGGFVLRNPTQSSCAGHAPSMNDGYLLFDGDPVIPLAGRRRVGPAHTTPERPRRDTLSPPSLSRPSLPRRGSVFFGGSDADRKPRRLLPPRGRAVRRFNSPGACSKWACRGRRVPYRRQSLRGRRSHRPANSWRRRG